MWLNRSVSALVISPPAMICQVRRADVIQYSRGLIAPSLHAAIEGFPFVARASKGGLTLALVQVAVTIFVNLTLGAVGHYRRLLNDWGLLTYRGLVNDWRLDNRGRLDDWGLLRGTSGCQ